MTDNINLPTRIKILLDLICNKKKNKKGKPVTQSSQIPRENKKNRAQYLTKVYKKNFTLT